MIVVPNTVLEEVTIGASGVASETIAVGQDAMIVERDWNGAYGCAEEQTARNTYHVGKDLPSVHVVEIEMSFKSVGLQRKKITHALRRIRFH